jgi:hypothetical protein
VRVPIEGHGYGGVPKKVLHQFGVDASPQEQRGARVPEIVPADRGEARTLEERLEVAIHYVLSVQRDALACCQSELIDLSVPHYRSRRASIARCALSESRIT